MIEVFALRIPEEEPPAEDLARWVHYVDEPFQTRVKRFRLWQDALRSLGGRLLLLWFMISRSIINDAREVMVGAEPKGKPILLRPLTSPSLSFNIAHDGDYILLGIQRDGSVGVDIMVINEDQMELLSEALEDQMTLNERRAISGSRSIRDKTLALTTIWCVKEAYVKAIGEGVSFGLTRIEVDLDDEADVRSIIVDGQSTGDTGWTYQAGYLGAQAYRWVCISRSQSNTMTVVPKELEWQQVLSTLADRQGAV